MTKSFDGFGEAAKLYAQYKAVVDEMEKAFDADILKFLNAVNERVKSGLTEGRLDYADSARSRYWWLDAPDKPATDSTPYAWVQRSDTRIISDSRLRVGVWADGVPVSVRDLVNDEVGALSLPGNCQREKYQGWSALTIRLGDDPVEATVQPLILLLQAIRNVEVRAIHDV